jgi:hypothetical protein
MTSPMTEVMPRTGRGTQANTDAGNTQHIIVEADARRVTDAATLHRASEAMMRVYEWPTTPAGDELDAEYGAPTSGGPPYRVYEIRPIRAFGLPTDGESFAPTRWRFATTE